MQGTRCRAPGSPSNARARRDGIGAAYAIRSRPDVRRPHPGAMPAPAMSHFADYARALQVLEEHIARRRAGATESAAALLARHVDLAEILAPMLEDGGPE